MDLKILNKTPNHDQSIGGFINKKTAGGK